LTFKKIRSAANRYRIIQVGLCLFTRKGANELEARPYNIFVFPRERPGFSPQIVLDASAMDFNTRHNMNWNTWVYDGMLIFSKFRNANIERYYIYDNERS
jgi:hypothetical protein